MTTPAAFRTRGAGTTPWARDPRSRAYGAPGIIVPTKPGFITTIEPWEPLMVSVARFVASEDIQVNYLQFRVMDAAGSNDACDVGILDEFGGVVYHSGLVSGYLNSVGAQFIAPASPVALEGGRIYYAAFGYGSGLAAPPMPTPSAPSAGGTVAAGTYQVAVSYVTAQGETVASGTAAVVASGTTSEIVVPSPPSITTATGWYAYVSQAGGSALTRQQAAGSPTAIGTNLTITAPPSNTGAAPPASNTTATTPATILTACYPGAPSLEGYGGSSQQYPWQDTAIYTTSDGSVKAPGAASGAVAPYVNWGEAALMLMRFR